MFLGSAAHALLATSALAPVVGRPPVPSEHAVFASQTFGKDELDGNVSVNSGLQSELLGTIGELNRVLVKALLGLELFRAGQRADGETEVAQVVGVDVDVRGELLAGFVAVGKSLDR